MWKKHGTRRLGSVTNRVTLGKNLCSELPFPPGDIIPILPRVSVTCSISDLLARDCDTSWHSITGSHYFYN